MAFVRTDRVKESTTSTGTGSIVLSGTSTGFRTFASVMANGDTTHFCIVDPVTGVWEVCTGMWTTGGNLSRLYTWSSSTGSAVSFTAGTKEVFMTLPAGAVLLTGATQGILSNGGDGDIFNGATNAMIDGGYISVVAGVPPAPPDDSRATLNAYNVGNSRAMMGQYGRADLNYIFQPALWQKRVGRWNPPGNSNTVPGIDGLPALTAVGTATARNVATTNAFTRKKRVGYVSVATAAGVASLRGAAQYTTGNGVAGIAGLGGFFFSVRFAVTDAAVVAGARMFIGMDAAAPTNVEMSTRTNCIGLAVLSSDTTQLYLVSGGSVAQTAINLGTVFPARQSTTGANNGIEIEFQLWSRPSENGIINYSVTDRSTWVSTGGSLVPTTPGVQTPGSTTLLAPSIYRTNNATALAVGIDILGLYIETDDSPTMF